MKFKSVLIVSIIVLGLIAIGFFSIRYVMLAKAQNDLVTDLTNRLSDVGVPVKDVSLENRFPLWTESRDPFWVSITIQKIGGMDEWSSEDLWFDQLTRREVELSYQLGYRIDGYSLRRLNSVGEEISNEKTFLSPSDPSQSPYPFNPTDPDDEFVKMLVMERIKTFGLSVDAVKVGTGIGSSKNVQLLTIHLSTQDRQLASQAIPHLVPAIRPMIEEINQQPGARIAIVWVQLVDSNQKIIMEYLWDLELHVERGGTIEGVTGWFTPPPAAEEYIPTATQPVGGEGPTQTDQPYP
jgi:hypothetical protein